MFDSTLARNAYKGVLNEGAVKPGHWSAGWKDEDAVSESLNPGEVFHRQSRRSRPRGYDTPGRILSGRTRNYFWPQTSGTTDTVRALSTPSVLIFHFCWYLAPCHELGAETSKGDINLLRPKICTRRNLLNRSRTKLRRAHPDVRWKDSSGIRVRIHASLAFLQTLIRFDTHASGLLTMLRSGQRGTAFIHSLDFFPRNLQRPQITPFWSQFQFVRMGLRLSLKLSQSRKSGEEKHTINSEHVGSSSQQRLRISGVGGGGGGAATTNRTLRVIGTDKWSSLTFAPAAKWSSSESESLNLKKMIPMNIPCSLVALMRIFGTPYSMTRMARVQRPSEVVPTRPRSQHRIGSSKGGGVRWRVRNTTSWGEDISAAIIIPDLVIILGTSNSA
ncbi:hypothetical protein B0H16DRAFT_1456114 [Mycena metata]|uniref:Uncharacterized protein n=1 Tax=Mycena metata TaxID=1033252 RepID=A0AAD7JCA3_9AGAR|nr:hypothetical protein B0H16DRAFT_1456114 [Mycena metata]